MKEETKDALEEVTLTHDDEKNVASIEDNTAAAESTVASELETENEEDARLNVLSSGSIPLPMEISNNSCSTFDQNKLNIENVKKQELRTSTNLEVDDGILSINDDTDDAAITDVSTTALETIAKDETKVLVNLLRKAEKGGIVASNAPAAGADALSNPIEEKKMLAKQEELPDDQENKNCDECATASNQNEDYNTEAGLLAYSLSNASDASIDLLSIPIESEKVLMQQEGQAGFQGKRNGAECNQTVKWMIVFERCVSHFK